MTPMPEQIEIAREIVSNWSIVNMDLEIKEFEADIAQALADQTFEHAVEAGVGIASVIVSRKERDLQKEIAALKAKLAVAEEALDSISEQASVNGALAREALQKLRSDEGK